MNSDTTKISAAIIVVGCAIALATYAGLTKEHRSFMEACVPQNINYGKDDASVRYYCEMMYQRRR